jgi:hypothetical protein
MNDTPAPSATFSVSSDGTVVTADLHHIQNQRRLTIHLLNVSDFNSIAPNVAIPMGVLVGDVDESARVDSNDVTSVRQQTLQTLTQSPPIFANDIDLSGRIDSNDATIARQQALTSLP